MPNQIGSPVNEYLVIWKDETTGTMKVSDINTEKGNIETLTRIISITEHLQFSRITIHEII